MRDSAQQMKWLVDDAYPDVPVVRVVLDNLNTHRMASLYEAFPPAEARRIARRLEFYYTPKHGSWLNMAEIEFSVLARACLRGATAMKTPCKEPSPYDTLTEQKLAPLKQKLFPGHDGLNGGNYHASLWSFGKSLGWTWGLHP